MSLEELLDKLKIAERPERSEDGSYVMDLNSSDELARYSSKMDRLADIGEFEELDNPSITDELIRVEYMSYDKKLLVTLVGYYDTEEYSLIIREL